MPIRTVFDTSIEHVSILDEHGHFDEKLGKGLIPDEDVVALYEHMGVCRHFDEVAFKLQRSGRMGTYPQNMGQEATSLGAAYAIRRDDWMVTCYRENTGLSWHGFPLGHILLHWMGDERGNRIPEGVYCTPIAIPIGTQMLHAAGLAWGAKYRGEDRIAVTFFGDGATSEGDFHEAANFAANLDLPVVFICQNNAWAISTPTTIQCSAPTVAQRGVAYGMECVQVDGNDLFAMVKVVRDAAEKARQEKRPTFIEAVTYRLGDHTTADDARRYRDPEELEQWKLRDPLIRLRGWLETRKLWDSGKEEALGKRAQKEVAAIVKGAEEITPPVPSDIFDHTYAEPDDDLLRQRDTLRTSSLGQRPGDVGAADAASDDDSTGSLVSSSHG
ncbi:MAG: pyruvate dehydrogenase (acetyl-transferring) E1 component subunit alpha [Planctomycetota bacterium]|jgi:pyruvate dehydrogenase E1 component alpha subunit